MSFTVFEALDDQDGVASKLVKANYQKREWQKAIESSLDLYQKYSGVSLKSASVGDEYSDTLFRQVIAESGGEVLEPLMKLGFTYAESRVHLRQSLSKLASTSS